VQVANGWFWDANEVLIFGLHMVGKDWVWTCLQSSLRFKWSLLGNSRKTCHPRNVKFDKIHEMSFQDGWLCGDLESWICEALKSWTCEDLESWICEALKSQTCEDLEYWICEALKSWTCEDLESRICEALKSRTCEDTESWTCEILKLGIYEIREFIEVQIRRLWCMEISMNKRLMNQ
jgi:hypothetical protein